MRKDEIIERNITLTFDFLRQVIENPTIIDNIPNGATIEFVQKDVPIIETKRTKKPDRFFKVKHKFEMI